MDETGAVSHGWDTIKAAWLFVLSLGVAALGWFVRREVAKNDERHTEHADGIEACRSEHKAALAQLAQAQAEAVGKLGDRVGNAERTMATREDIDRLSNKIDTNHATLVNLLLTRNKE